MLINFFLRNETFGDKNVGFRVKLMHNRSGMSACKRNNNNMY